MSSVIIFISGALAMSTVIIFIPGALADSFSWFFFRSFRTNSGTKPQVRSRLIPHAFRSIVRNSCKHSTL